MNADEPSNHPPSSHPPRDRNRRGQGDRLRADIIEAGTRLLDELGDDQALSMRAVARAVGSAATSVYLHFADRDELVLAVLNRCHDQLAEAVDTAEAAADGPAGRLRARMFVLGWWAYEHPGLYKVLHESTLNQRTDMPFKRQLAERTTEVVRECLDAGLSTDPDADAATIALDLRAAVHGAVSLRLNQPDHPWPPLTAQIDRYLVKLAGLRPSEGQRR